MYLFCPNCQSTKIKKNGHTYYGKQNHQCKCCGRQFVLNNKHTKPEWLKFLIEKALKERLSLRAICRVFGVSLTWLQAFSHLLWEQTPRHLGISAAVEKRIKKLQVFGIQADELWSFVQKKKRKRWIWVAYDPVHRLVVACYIGGRGKSAAKKFWKKIPSTLRECYFETDHWEAYQSIIPKNQHKVGKDLTYYIEGFNATIRARVSRLVRKALSFSKLEKWHNLAIQWFFWQFNLEQQHYM
ncbi:MAG: IS1 family transposase [Lewinella sp.]|jgi:IS1 family transposase|uniref:IS1 family transposase n=1 Tax=Lewinella sp. TaxID=2004506 RepID=UPI003D6BA9CE